MPTTIATPKPTPATASTATSVLRECAASLAPKTEPGLENLRALCPKLEQAIDDSHLDEQLADWEQRIGPQGLQDLIRLMDRYQAVPASAAPSPSSLAPIVNAIRRPEAKSVSWWEQLKNWLRSLLSPEEESNSNWLERLLAGLQSIPRQVLKIIWYSALAVIVGFAGWLVWRELKLAGVLGRQSSAQASRRSPLPDGATARSPTDWTQGEDLDNASPRDRPVLLLRLLVRALVSSGRLKSERSLTHSELTRRGRFDTAEQLQRFTRLASLAEQRLYGPDVVGASPSPSPSPSPASASASDEASVLRDGRELYAELSMVGLSAAGSSPTGKLS